MKIVDICGGYRIVVSSEESMLIEEIKIQGKMSKKELSERQNIVANRLVSKGVLDRQKDIKGIYYSFRALSNIDI